MIPNENEKIGENGTKLMYIYKKKSWKIETRPSWPR